VGGAPIGGGRWVCNERERKGERGTRERERERERAREREEPARERDQVEDGRCSVDGLVADALFGGEGERNGSRVEFFGLRGEGRTVV
jgi:hypothetical protein